MAGAAPSLISLLVASIFAYYTGRTAARKGRRAVPWGVLGFLTGIIGLGIAYFTPAKQPALD